MLRLIEVVLETSMEHHQHQRPSSWRMPTGIAAAVLAVAATIYLYVTHKDHLLAALPFLLLAACPLMHVFMHRGHGQAHGQKAGSPQQRGEENIDDRT
jgi:hypothetical protein